MNWTKTKPTEEGLYLYREGDRCLSVEVESYQDLQSGIPRNLTAVPKLPRFGNLSIPAWSVDSMNGEWANPEIRAQ